MSTVICLTSGIPLVEIPGMPTAEAVELKNVLIEAGFEVEIRDERAA